MKIITIDYKDDGWHVSCSVDPPREGVVKGWSYANAFKCFDTAMMIALEELANYDGESVITTTRGVAKIALRQLGKVAHDS